LGEFYVATNQPEKALAEFASLYSEHPKDVIVANIYTQLLISGNRVDEAVKVNDATLKIASSDPNAQVLHGELLIRQGKSDDAIHVLEKAAKDAPNDAGAHYQL